MTLHTQHKLNYFVEKSLRNKITTTTMDEVRGAKKGKKRFKIVIMMDENALKLHATELINFFLIFYDLNNKTSSI